MKRILGREVGGGREYARGRGGEQEENGGRHASSSQPEVDAHMNSRNAASLPVLEVFSHTDGLHW